MIGNNKNEKSYQKHKDKTTYYRNKFYYRKKYIYFNKCNIEIIIF